MKVILISLLVATLALAGHANPTNPQQQEQINVSNEGPVATGNQNVTSEWDMGEALEELITALQEIMPCGNEALGIPKMSPFKLPVLSVNLSTEHFTVNGQVKNLVITGMQEILIVNMATEATTNYTEFDLLYKNQQVLGEFDINVSANFAGFQYALPQKGFLNLQIIDQRVSGGFTFGPNDVGGAKLSNVNFNLQVAEVNSKGLNTKWSVAVNNYVNQLINDSIMLFIAEHREYLNTMYSDYVTTMVNQALLNVPVRSVTSYIGEMAKMLKSQPCN